ncbi:fatty acid-binding protein-like [Portunus trituberculatus]|uniref:fatty acid-binding protein-like n=1 Tax=Portunus trituberculatus TaxID=210409 RepID=UPI001E1CE57C|nr:fatty acid-binding protein-like [Portunus trituberculatus]
MVQFNGTYKLEKNENLDAFLSKMDVGFMKRKMAGSVKPSVVIEVEGDKWKLVTHTPASTITWDFTLGTEVTLPTNEGREVKAVFTLEGNKLIQRSLTGKEAEVDNVREFTDDAFIMHLTHKESGLKCTRTFKRT